MEKVDLLVVGGGAAGMSAALAAASAGAVSVLLADREARLGGILPQCIHHGFGLGYFHRDLVLGSGDLGLIVARRLALTGCQVVGVVEQQGSCGGMVRNYRSCLLEHNIPLITKATVTRLHGEGRLTGVTLRRLDSGREEQVSCDTLVTALGLIPERELLDSLGGKVPGWASLCGNCDYVHEIVDTVTTQAEELGRRVGLELLGRQ